MSESGAIKSIAEPGVRATGQLLQDMRREVADLLERRQTSFPGAQPVSFTREHLEELRRQE
jgi:mRNA guanylyltransferase